VRLFENLALFTLLLILAWSFAPEKRRPRTVLFAPALTWILFVIHFIVEGARWQMLPAYFLAVGLTLNNIRLLSRKRPSPKLNAFVRMLVVVLFLVIFLAIYQLPQILPVFTLPPPNGIFAVGTTGFTLVDASRDETLTPDRDDKRQVPVRIWYPAEAEQGMKPVKYWSDHPEYSRYLTRELDLPVFLLDHLKLVETHAYPAAPLASADDPFPVVIFQHGYRLGYLEQNTSLMETLASNGYVVISLAHPYEAIAAPLADGSQALYTSDMDAFLGSDSAQEASLELWAADTAFVLDTFSANLSGGPFDFLNDRLDLTRVGLAGMSFGGSTTSLVCLTDERCKAGLTLDSPQYSAVLNGQLSQPFLFMVSDNGQYREQEVFDQASGPAYQITVKGTEHYNFTDLTLISPLAAALNFSGPIDGQQMVKIINSYSLAFFDKHLKGLSAPILNGISAEFPEVSIDSRNSR